MHRSAINLNAGIESQPYSDAVWNGDTLLFSGRVAMGDDKQFIDAPVGEQTAQTLVNISNVLERAGLTLADVLKTTVFLTTMDDYAAMNAAYVRAFEYPFPARTCVAVSGLPFGAAVEIEVLAVRRPHLLA
jgi:2-iminobutanoate/2-iminopropanoate deaminase